MVARTQGTECITMKSTHNGVVERSDTCRYYTEAREKSSSFAPIILMPLRQQHSHLMQWHPHIGAECPPDVPCGSAELEGTHGSGADPSKLHKCHGHLEVHHLHV